MKNLKILLVFILFTLFIRAETMYVTALKTKLLKDPNSQGQFLDEISRGEAIDVKKTEGAWLQVLYKNKTGWISKLFVSKIQPLKNSDINNLKQLDSEKVGRVRLNYENKGAARGLTDSVPKVSRNGFSDNKKIHAGVKTIESQEATQEEIQKFQKDGKLKP